MQIQLRLAVVPLTCFAAILKRESVGERVVPLALATLALVCCFFSVAPTLAQTGLEYRDRGNRYEGVRPKPVSGYNIELISALVNSNETAIRMPDRLKMRFYLDQSSQVYLTVRELDYKYYYWMDRIQPSAPWSSGFNNVFEWSTADVLQQLPGVTIADLGALARLGKAQPSAIEHVAPIMLYSAQAPTKVQEYLFAFKTSADARLRCLVYRHGEKTPLYSLPLPRQRGERPFVVRWNSSAAAKGVYDVIIEGYFLDTNAPIHQTVSFYHQPSVGQ